MLETSQCPELLADGSRCTATAEIIDRRALESTNGPVEHVRTRCFGGHILFCLAESLAPEQPAEVDLLEAEQDEAA